MEKTKTFIILLIAVLHSAVIKAQFQTVENPDSTNKYELPDVVVSANKFEINVENSQTKIEILDYEEINNSNGTRLPELLNISSSVFIKSYGFGPQLSTISLNGLGGEHTIILYDGVKLNSFQNSLLDLALIPKAGISRIEILNNGSSSLYGSEAVAGVVNIISDNRPLISTGREFQINASLSGGSFETYNYSAGLSALLNNFNARAYYSHSESAGNYKYTYDNGIEMVEKHRENSGYNIRDGGINVQYLPEENNRLRFISTYSYQDKEIPGIVTGITPPNTSQKDEVWNNILLVENIISSSTSIRSQFNYQNNLQHYNVQPVLNSYYKNLVYSAGSMLNYTSGIFNLAGGIDFSYGSLTSNEVEQGAIRKIRSIFASSEIIILGNFRLFPSARYEHISDINKNVFTYKAGFNYQPFPGFNLSLRGNVGKNFRAPTFNDLYWKESGNKELIPESSFNAEAGMIYSFDIYLKGQIDLAYTYINVKDKIVWRPQRNLIWKPENIDESISKSVSISASLSKNWGYEITTKINAGFTIVNSTKTSENYPGDPSFNKHFPFLPLQSFKLNGMFSYKSIGINLFYSHTGRRYSDFENKTELNSFDILDGNIVLMTKLLEIFAEIKFEVNNILNTRYQIIPGYPLPLRNFNLTLSIIY